MHLYTYRDTVLSVNEYIRYSIIKSTNRIFENRDPSLIYIYIYIYTVLSVNEYTPLKSNILNNLNEHNIFFQNVDKTKFNITSV